jgi:predicted amidohydrolase YtcJ
VLVREGGIVALGSSAELRKRGGKGTVVVDAGGRAVVSPLGDHALARGAPANLLIVEGSVAEPPTVVREDVVFALEEGRIVSDRNLLARLAGD